MPVKKTFPAVHPGEILGDWLTDFAITRYRLAADLGVDATAIGNIVRGKRSITAEMDVMLSRFFSMTPGFWLSLQMDYDLQRTIEEKSATINRRVKRLKQTAA